MTNSIASRRSRAALLVFSGALLIGLAACSSDFGPPPPGATTLTPGQQHYLELQKRQADHDSRRSERSSPGGLRSH